MQERKACGILTVPVLGNVAGFIQPLLEADDVHLRVGEAPRHGSAGGARADDQHIHRSCRPFLQLGAACLDHVRRCNRLRPFFATATMR